MIEFGVFKFLDEIDEIIIRLKITQIQWINRKAEKLDLRVGSNIFEQIFFDGIDKLVDSIYEQKRFYVNQVVRFPSGDSIYTEIIYIPEDEILIIRDKTKEKLIEEIKYNLVTSISHEILTPLSSLKAYAFLLKEKYPEIEPVENILRAVKRIERVVKQTQLIAMAQMGLYELKKSIVDPKKIFEEVRHDLSKLINQKNIILKFSCEAEFLNADGFVVYTILRNLISNAVKYSFENSSVEVLITDEIIQVRDYGIGIKKEELSKIFQRFYRGSEAIKMAPKGSGLGLAVVKHLCKLAGYEIEVESEWMLETTFKIHLK